MVPHKETLKSIKEFFKKKGLSVNDGNRKQGYFPEGSIVLPNPVGTAPACIIEDKNVKLILLPGPPRENIPIFEKQIIPYLQKYQDKVFVSKTLNITGIGEGQMEEMIMDIIKTKRIRL